VNVAHRAGLSILYRFDVVNGGGRMRAKRPALGKTRCQVGRLCPFFEPRPPDRAAGRATFQPT
jgi:hypothetical protein